MNTPYFTISKSKALDQFNIVKDVSDIVSYSSKTNPEVSKILESSTDCMFSIHLKDELKNIDDKSRVLFLAQAWDYEQIDFLVNQGIRWFVVDNISDLDMFKKFLDHYDGKLNLLLRLKLKEHSIRTEKYYVFGMYSDFIRKSIRDLRVHSSDKLDNLGIHFHRKSQNMSEWNIKCELENTFDGSFWDEIDIINIGGGLPSVYANTNVDVFEGILKKIADFRLWINSKKIKLMMEPGRFIAAPAGELHTSIIGIHENTVVVDASVYNGDLDALVVPVKLLVKDELEKDQGSMYVIKGITPCSMDIFRYRVYLKEKKVGEKIVFINAGAYNFGSDFCGQEKLITLIVE